MRKTVTAIIAAGALALAGCAGTEDTLAEPPITAEPSLIDDTPSPEDTPTPETSASKEEKPAAKETTKQEKMDDPKNAPAGTVCGEVTSKGDGRPLSVVALYDNSDCDEAMEVMSDYFSDSPTGGPPQGSGAFWHAPNGWVCGGSNYLIPGDEDHKMNKYPSCGPGDNEESFVAVEPERVSELPV